MNNNNTNGSNDDNNNTVRHSSSEYKLYQLATTPNLDLDPVGYEPENSLRRITPASRPTQLRRATGIRRRSALDKPSANPIGSEREINIQSPLENSDYEPENSLRRPRKSADSSKITETRRRARRGTTMVGDSTFPSQNTSITLENEKIPLIGEGLIGDWSSDSGFASDGSPGTPRSGMHKLLMKTPSIPEGQELRNDRNPTIQGTPSPRNRRKISFGLPPGSPRSLPRNSSNLQLNGKFPSGSPLLSPSSGTSKSRRASVDVQIACNSIKARRSSLSSPGPLPQNLSSTSLTRTKPSLPNLTLAVESPGEKKNNSTRQVTTAGRHMNADRYWQWYLLNASYSWQNFNTDSRYCY